MELLKKLKNALFLFVVTAMLVGAASSASYAAGSGTVDLAGVSVDTASVLELAAIILVAIGAIWGIKKLIKLANRS